jgi:hypothetical protein
MADFYQLTKGALHDVTIRSTRQRRASAQTRTGEIFPGANFDKRVLWHEMAHHLELNQISYSASEKLIEDRRESDKLHSLRSLTGVGYSSSEVAVKDGFIDPYMGKVYQHAATEIMAMGLESFSDPLKLANFIDKDRDSAEFILGFLGSISQLDRDVADQLNNQLGTNKAEKENREAPVKEFIAISSKLKLQKIDAYTFQFGELFLLKSGKSFYISTQPDLFGVQRYFGGKKKDVMAVLYAFYCDKKGYLTKDIDTGRWLSDNAPISVSIARAQVAGFRSVGSNAGVSIPKYFPSGLPVFKTIEQFSALTDISTGENE